MLNEIVTQSHILTPGVEQTFGTLTSPHQLAEIIINANGAVEANSSEWRLYDVAAAGAALIWRGVLTPPFEGPQRLTPIGGIGAGALIELRALLNKNVLVPTSVAITASLIGYDPDCCAENTGPTGPEAGGGDSIYVWGRHAETPTGEIFLTPGFDAQSDPDAVALTTDAPVPFPAGTFSEFRVQQNGVGDGTGQTEYTLMVNGVATAITVTLGLTDTYDENLVDEVTIVDGDLVGLRATLSGEEVTSGPTDITVSIKFRAAP
jgi:hypothetical protein